MRELYSIEAEKSMIGGLIMSGGRCFDDIAGSVSSSDMVTPACVLVFDAVSDLVSLNRPVDVVTVSEHLENKNQNEFESVGGMNFLIECAKNVPSTLNLPRYAEIIEELSRERQLYQAAVSIQGIIMKDGVDTPERFQEAEAIFTAVSESRDVIGVSDWNHLLKTAVDTLDKRFNGEVEEGLMSGLLDIDKRLTGFKKGELYVVAGRPGMGKTTYAMSVFRKALLDGKKIFFSSLEMPESQLTERLIASIGGILLSRIKSGKLEEDDWSKLTNAINQLKDKSLRIIDKDGMDVNQLRSECRRMKRKEGLDLVVVDYLQLLSDRSVKNGRFEEVSSISRKLKGLAKELDCSVIALSQLSRKCEERSDKRPIPSDLRESGQIEQDADVIQFLYRDEVYNEHSVRKGIIEVITAKFRDGESGTDYLAFLGSINRIDNLAQGFTVPPEPVDRNNKRGFE
jgi:replicative DNA helicase